MMMIMKGNLIEWKFTLYAKIKNDLNLEYQRKCFGSLTIKNSICVAVSHKHHGSAHDD